MQLSREGFANCLKENFIVLHTVAGSCLKRRLGVASTKVIIWSAEGKHVEKRILYTTCTMKSAYSGK